MGAKGTGKPAILGGCQVVKLLSGPVNEAGNE